MSLYYFHLRDGVDILLDPEGRELANRGSIPEAALKEARSIIGHDAVSGRILLDQHIDVEDEFRNILHTLHFADAVEIVRP
ncbi:MAG TPA: hypothetical protein VF650_11445 [Allosphingosinicella sp.]|jgi:hypothetical protein